jgi:probable rRNA maturation factor
MADGFQPRLAQGRERPPLGQDLAPNRRRTLALSDRQRLHCVDLRLLRQIVQALLGETWPDGSFDLAIYVVAAPEMIRLNETFLRHKGPTDVIAFSYAEASGPRSRLCPGLLHGEIFVCADEAVSQARRYHTTWPSELVRYIVHGVLHLLGHDDLQSRARRRMKKAEDALLRLLARRFDFERLSSKG